MKVLFNYLKPLKWLIFLTLLLASVNTGFSLMDPIIFGKLVNLANENVFNSGSLTKEEFFWSFSWSSPGVMMLLLMSVGVALVSRLAKNFQDYFLNVIVQKFGAKIFTDGLKHAMKLPYQEFEDQRSGETLSILNKVRSDTARFINYIINVLFGIVVGILFVCVYAGTYIHWAVPIVYFVGIIILTWLTNILSKKIKMIISAHDDNTLQTLKMNQSYIERFCNPETLQIALNVDSPEKAMTAVVSGAEIYLPLEGLIDIEEEIARLEKELEKLNKEVERVEKKLSNENFVSKAPKAVVEAEREKHRVS